MATMRMISVIVFTLSGGLAPWAGAQQMDSPPPVYSPPSLQEPPPLSSSPRQSRPLTGDTQPYAEPRTSVPMASSRAELEMEKWKSRLVTARPFDSSPGLSRNSLCVRRGRGRRAR